MEITVTPGQKVHYHAAWDRDIATTANYVELSTEHHAVILPIQAEIDWTCGMDDGTLCVEDVSMNRETTENFILQDGAKAIALDPTQQPDCDHWAALYADCWQ